MISNVGISSLINNAEKMGWKIIILLTVPGLFLVVQAFSWWNCIDHNKSNVKLSTLILTQIAGWAFSEIGPLSSFAGDTLKGIIIKNRVKGSTIVSSLVLYNTLHIFATITIFIIGIIITFIILEISSMVKIAGIGSILVTILILLMFVKKQQRGLLLSIFNLLLKFKFLKKKLSDKKEKVIEIDNELKHFWTSKKKNYLAAYLFLISAKVFGALEYYLILKFIGYPQSFLIAMFMFIISSVIFVVIFFIPSQIGVVTGGLNRTFKLLGFDPSYGTLVGVFRRLRVITWTLFGLILIPVLGISLKKSEIKIEEKITE